MGLRAKLFTSIGILACIYAIVIFFVPTYIVINDLGHEGMQLRRLIVEKNSRLLRAQEILLREVFQRIRNDLNSFLFVIYDMPLLQKELALPENDGKDGAKSTARSWNEMVRIANYNPDIGFLQLSNLDQTEVAVLKPADATLYDITTSPISDKLLAIHFPQLSEGELESEYLGIKLEKQSSDDSTHNYYALLPWSLTKKHLEALEKEIDSFESNFVSARHLGVGQIFTSSSEKISGAEDWTMKNALIHSLVPLVVSNYVEYEEGAWAPAGIATFEDGNNHYGQALMTQEVMSTKLVVDAKAHFETHLPPADSPPIAQGDLFITSDKIDHIFIANTIKTDMFYLTVGTPVNSLAQQLATWSQKDILIRVGDELWLGYGDVKQDAVIKSIKAQIRIPAKSSEEGVLALKGKLYRYTNLANLSEGQLGFYQLTRVGGEVSIAKLSVTVAKRVAWKISFQLFVISLLLIGVIFLMVSRGVLINAIRPIVKLAEATQCVVEGRYTDVVLPKMGKRVDEVATLSTAFSEMVVGLQEKEKIRGVLNKVVSKDVADEILKSNIRLGGEDREVTVLFADIRGFTSMTESLAPQETIALLNEAMTKIAHIIEAEGGIVDKFVGDEVMAIFGAPVTTAEHALHAVSAGMMILQTIQQWNEERKKRDEVPIHIGIGINSGIAVAGNMGAEDRLNYTVLGANVNLASRLCSHAKGNELIISGQTFDEVKVKDSFFTKSLPPATLKGISQSVPIYQVTGFNWDSE